MTSKFTEYIIDYRTSLKDAMFALDKSGEKIIFIEKNGKIIGSLTDGDVRRWILSMGDINEAVETVCNKNFTFITAGYDSEEVKNIFLLQRYSCIPVLNKDYEVVDLIFWQHIFGHADTLQNKSHLNLPVVIMAGGKGTRLDPFTKILPKPLIPIGDKSIIELIISKFLIYSIDSFILSINHKSNIIKAYFQELNPPYQISYIQEDEPLGTVGSLRLLPKSIQGDIFVTNCDILIDADYSDIYKEHIENNNDVTLVVSLKHIKIPYGVCEIVDGGELVKIIEKPEYDYLVNTGMYILRSELLKYIPVNRVFHMTDLIHDLKVNGFKVGVYPITEHSWIDIGEWAEYKKAVLKFTI